MGKLISGTPDEKWKRVMMMENAIFFPDGSHFEAPTEFDQHLNTIQLHKMEVFKEIHGDCWLGKVNRYSEDKGEPYLKQASRCFNFEYSFMIPKYDPWIIRMIKNRETTTPWESRRDYKMVEAIHDRVEKLGGIQLHWV